MTRRVLYLAAYDISHPDRLRRALHVLRDYATGGQKSVFECFLAPDEAASLVRRVASVIDREEDRFILVQLGGRIGVRTLGCARPPQDPDFFYYE